MDLSTNLTGGNSALVLIIKARWLPVPGFEPGFAAACELPLVYHAVTHRGCEPSRPSAEDGSFFANLFSKKALRRPPGYPLPYAGFFFVWILLL